MLVTHGSQQALDLLVRVHPDWAAGLRLIVVDEAHLLGDGWHRLEPTALVHFAVDPTGWR